MGSRRASPRGRSPSLQRSSSLQRSPSPPSTIPSLPPGSRSPCERYPLLQRSSSRSPSRRSSPHRSPLRSPSRSFSSHSSRSSSHHSSRTAFQHASRSPLNRSHSSGRRSASPQERERSHSPAHHSSRLSSPRSSQRSQQPNVQQQQIVNATGWSPTFSHRSVRTTARSPSPNISPRSSHPSLRQSSHQSQYCHHFYQPQPQLNNLHKSNTSSQTGPITKNTSIATPAQPCIPTTSSISHSVCRKTRSRSRSRSRHLRWQHERSRDIARERQLSHFVYHNPHNPASYGSSIYADSRNRGRREYGFGPGVLRDFGTPHGEDRWNDVDRLLDPTLREMRGRNLWRGTRRSHAGGDEYVYGNSSTRRNGLGDGGVSGLATIATGLIGLGAGVAVEYAGAQAANNRYDGTLGSYRRPRQRRSEPNRSSVQPLVELVTNRPDNPNQTYIERSPSRERSPSGEFTRPCHRRNSIEGSPSREKFFTAYDHPRRPSRTREKDWPHFPPTLANPSPNLLANPPPYASSSLGGSVCESLSGDRPPSDRIGAGKDAVVNSASPPAVITSKAGVSRKVSTNKTPERRVSNKTTSRPERSANASTDYPPRQLPVRGDYLTGSNTTYNGQSYQPSGNGGVSASATLSAGYMGPSHTAGTVSMVGDDEELRLEKTGTRMARLRARLCGGIDVPAA